MDLRHEAMLMLEKKGSVLDVARDVSRLLRETGVNGAVIGGIAVVLHGYVRTTRDVDILLAKPLEGFAHALEDAGATFDRAENQHVLSGIPVHLVPHDIAGGPRDDTIEIDGILTVSLPDLINMKLRSGLGNLARAQDIADVVGLIRERRLTATFAAKIDKPLRAEFRKLVRAVRSS